MARLQEWIHNMEEGRGAKLVKLAGALLVFITVALLYDLRAFKNFSSQEAMDAAQLARNIADGKGYTTDFVRPFSLYLLKEHGKDPLTLLQEDHPDLANAPVYPVVLAAWLKLMPVNYEIPGGKPFSVYFPERWIAILNQLLLVVAALMVYALGKRLFDRWVGLVAALLFVGTELFWRFSVSGLSTMLLMVIVLGVFRCLVALDEGQRDKSASSGRMASIAAMAGLLIGLAGLTRYSFIFLIVPALALVLMFAPAARAKVAWTMGLVFLLVVTPWIVRNYMVSGTPFGTAGYAVMELTPPFPEDSLQRSIDPGVDFDRLTINDFVRKLAIYTRAAVETQIPKMGGNWITAFFLAGVLMPFRNKTLSRMRLLLLGSLALFILVQAWGRTQLSETSPDLSSENLLVILAPMVFIFGAGFFFVLLEQLDIPYLALKQAIIALFGVIVCAPMILAILPPKVHPYAYPPYFPPTIQQIGRWMKEKELTMSDIPWAVAWYGDRQCVWTTLNYDKDFYKINDDIKPVQALYLSPATMDNKLLFEIIRPIVKGEKPWGRFVFESLARGEVPPGFPLKQSRMDILPDHLFLTDWERWKVPAAN